MVFHIVTPKLDIVYLKLKVANFIDDPDYYSKAHLYYFNILKDTDKILVMAVYRNNFEKIINTPILSKAEALNILKILTKDK